MIAGKRDRFQHAKLMRMARIGERQEDRPCFHLQVCGMSIAVSFEANAIAVTGLNGESASYWEQSITCKSSCLLGEPASLSSTLTICLQPAVCKAILTDATSWSPVCANSPCM